MEAPLEIIAGVGVELTIFLVALGVFLRFWGKFLPLPTRVEIPPFKRGILLRREQIVGTLEPGQRWIGPQRTVLLYDTRAIPFHIQAQEILTSDGSVVRVGIRGEYQIVRPAEFVTASSNASNALLLEARQAMQIAVSELNGDSFVAALPGVRERIQELLVPKASQLGIQVNLIELSEALPLGSLTRG